MKLLLMHKTLARRFGRERGVCDLDLDFEIRETIFLCRCLQRISSLCRTMIPEVFLPIIVPVRFLCAAFQPEAAGRGRN
jgi:hypothetical protein